MKRKVCAWIKVKVTCKEDANVDQSERVDDVMDGYVGCVISVCMIISVVGVEVV